MPATCRQRTRPLRPPRVSHQWKRMTLTHPKMNCHLICPELIHPPPPMVGVIMSNLPPPLVAIYPSIWALNQKMKTLPVKLIFLVAVAVAAMGTLEVRGESRPSHKVLGHLLVPSYQLPQKKLRNQCPSYRQGVNPKCTVLSPPSLNLQWWWTQSFESIRRTEIFNPSIKLDYRWRLAVHGFRCQVRDSITWHRCITSWQVVTQQSCPHTCSGRLQTDHSHIHTRSSRILINSRNVMPVNSVEKSSLARQTSLAILELILVCTTFAFFFFLWG